MHAAAFAEDFLCVKEITKVVHIALPALYISNEVAGVTEILESWKSQYVKQLQGVVVNYKNVSFNIRSGFIVVDKPYVHYDVKATFELFCPAVRSIIKGKINRISREHIGCLVHNVINASIHLPKDVSSEISKLLFLDRTIYFMVTRFDFHRRCIRVKGEITEECIELMKKLFPQLNEISDAETFVSCSVTTEHDSSENDTFSVAQRDEDVDNLLNNFNIFNSSEHIKSDIKTEPLESDKKSRKKKKKASDANVQKKKKREAQRATARVEDTSSSLETSCTAENDTELSINEVDELMITLSTVNPHELPIGDIKEEPVESKKRSKKKRKSKADKTRDTNNSLNSTNVNLSCKEEPQDGENDIKVNAEEIDKLIGTLSTFKPSNPSVSNMKQEPTECNKKSKKRKRDSLDTVHQKKKKHKSGSNRKKSQKKKKSKTKGD